MRARLKFSKPFRTDRPKARQDMCLTSMESIQDAHLYADKKEDQFLHLGRNIFCKAFSSAVKALTIGIAAAILIELCLEYQALGQLLGPTSSIQTPQTGKEPHPNPLEPILSAQSFMVSQNGLVIPQWPQVH